MQRVIRASLISVVAACALAFGAPAASAAVSSVLSGQTISGGAIPCPPQTDNVRVCHGTYNNGAGSTDIRLKSFDGTPLEIYVILPPAPASGTDGDYPLVVQSHGWGGSAGGPNDTEFLGPTADSWAKQGYAVLQLTARGFGDSCGSSASRLAAATACLNGYIRLDDERYEARDVQYAIGLLVDEGLVDPNRIGVTGESYGGGVSLELATLKNRVMNANGTLSPWASPNGTALHIAAAAPMIPWSDLAASLVPNGHTLDYQVTSPTADLNPIGVEKQSFVAGLYALGQATGYYAPPGVDSQADLTTWFAELNAGEPYTSTEESLIQGIAQYHSPYYLLDGAFGTAKESPAPLLIGNGFTDDLFPVDEALRYYNLDRSLYPSDPIALFDGDFGHQPSNNKPGDIALLTSRIQSFFDHYVKGSGPTPQLGATAMVMTCPKSEPSGGPYSAATWAGLHPGEVDYSSKPAQTLDPVTGDNACATVPAADQGSGVATYRLAAATGSGYTLLGSPTVIANLNVTGLYPEIAARLWDVDKSTNTETLVARGVYRLDPNAPDGLQVFQLHPGAWHFAAGHVAKLELLGQDAPYVRKSNGVFSISVTDLQLRLPVHEKPGSAPVVSKPLPPVTPKPHKPKACVARPTTKIKNAHWASRSQRLTVSGRAHETPCASASKATRKHEHVTRVWVIVYRTAKHGRCQFLQKDGKLTKARSCKRTVELLARGGSSWSLKLHAPLPAGTYRIHTDAADALKHHQKRSPSGRFKIR
jgi:dienelactone hydrolase